MSLFTGAGVAMITPMKSNGEVDFEKMKEIVDFHVNNGTDAIIVCGTTGEAATLSHEEHLECIRKCVEFTNKRIPVIAGTGSNCTETAIYLSTEAEKAGVDGLLVVTPYYNKCTQNGLKAHFKAIANSVKVPILLYNVPSRTGVTIAADTVVELCKTVDNIVGVKDATGDLSEVAEIMSKADGQVDLYSGNDDQITAVVALGGKGVISVLSNILPQETHDMVETMMNDNPKASAALQCKYFKLIKLLFSEVNPIPVKKAMNLMGMGVGSLRMPLTEMEEAHAQALAAEMKNVGITLK